jgi:hypothetical protein
MNSFTHTGLVLLGLLGVLSFSGRVGAGELRLIERRVEIRQKTEAEADLPPNCVLTGLGARAHVDNITTLHIQYRPLLEDGSLGPPGEIRLGSEPDHGCEAKIYLPPGWIVVGFGARGAPEWDVATFRVWGRRWDPTGAAGEVRIWSDGREPAGGLERSILLQEPDRVLVGAGLRFHQNDIQGIYARSARIVRLPRGYRSLRRGEPSGSVPVLRLLPRSLGPVAIAALDADRIQAELLDRWREGARVIAVDGTGLTGTAGEPALDVCESLLKDPFQAADGVLEESIRGRIGGAPLETAARALSRVPLIARLAFSAAGKRFLGKNGIPEPEEVPTLEANDVTLRAVAGEKETARWLLVQSRGEVARLLEGRSIPWLERVAAELEDLGRAADAWEHLARAEILSRMYLVDGAPSTREEAKKALEGARAVHLDASFGDPRLLARIILERVATPGEKTRLGRVFANIERLAGADGDQGSAEAAATDLAALLDDDSCRPHLRRHWDTIGRLASGIKAFGMEADQARILWGGDGRWRVEKRAGRWAWVTAPGGP